MTAETTTENTAETTAENTAETTAETYGFQAEVSKLLDIVAHSLYSEKEIFLRELVSNASDACDKLRYEAITKPDLLSGEPDFKIAIAIDKKAKTLTVSDNGVGMSKDELVDNLGTIARSGTAAFVAGLSGEAAKDASLIGQFGVGFYSSFMVADKVEVLTRRAGETNGWRWSSDGKGAFAIEESQDAPARGASVIVHLKKDAKDFLEPAQVSTIVRKYADHIAVPVALLDGDKEETLNAASALWTRPKKDITPEQYTEFYHHTAHAFDEPWLTLHWKAEGKIEYSALLYVPSQPPFDLFQPERKHQLRLYVSRVFITDDCEGLLPSWLRFLRGVVDSEDLPLNISREMLQHNPVLAKIRQGLVKRTLSELKKKAEAAPEDFAAFWDNFGAVLKEGLYEDAGQRDELLSLARFRSTAGEGLTSLAAYVGRMKDGQEAIYTLAGEDAEQLRASPHLEGFLARGVEVLLLTDPVDEFWAPAIGSFEDKPFKSITRGAADLEKFEPETKDGQKKPPKKASAKSVDTLIAFLKLALKDAVKDVRTTERLTDSPVCLVADESDMDMHLERILKQHRQLDQETKRILEINPAHGVIKALAKTAEAKGAQAALEDAAFVLLDQARIMEGEPVPDPAAFGRRLSGLMEKGLAG
jgi:molecular chaperone HtpG